MIKIVVLGYGLIPRGKGIAPRRDPFKVDLQTLKTILGTDGLQVFAVNPLNNIKTRLNFQNFERIYKKYEADEGKKAEPVSTIAASTDSKKAVIKVGDGTDKRIDKAVETALKAEEVKKPEVVESVETKTAEEETPLVPVNNPNNQNGNNNNYKHKH